MSLVRTGRRVEGTQKLIIKNKFSWAVRLTRGIMNRRSRMTAIAVSLVASNTSVLAVCLSP